MTLLFLAVLLIHEMKGTEEGDHRRREAGEAGEATPLSIPSSHEIGVIVGTNIILCAGVVSNEIKGTGSKDLRRRRGGRVLGKQHHLVFQVPLR